MVEFQWLLSGYYWGLICIPRREVRSWNLDPLAGIIDYACFFLPSTLLLEVFSLSGALLVQLLLLTFFRLTLAMLISPRSGATVVDGVKHKGRVVAVCVIHANSQIPVVKRDAAVSLQFQS